MRGVVVSAALLAGACGAAPPPQPDPRDPVAATPLPDCSQAVPLPPAKGSTLAFLTSSTDAVRTYSIQSSGCWVRMDEDQGLGDTSYKVVHASGRYLFAAGHVATGKSGVRVFAVDAARAALEPVGDEPVGRGSLDGPNGVVAIGDTLYMTTAGGGTGYHGGFWQFSFDPGRGRLSSEGAAFRNRDPQMLEASPARSVLYYFTGDWDRGNLRVLRTLKPDTAGRLGLFGEIAAAPGLILADPTGAYVWISEWSGEGKIDTLSVYHADPDGVLFRSASLPWDRRLQAAHPSGTAVYALGPGTIESYRVDRGSGQLALVTSVPYAASRVRLAADPSGEWLYAVTGDEVRAYRTDEKGALVERGRAGEGGFLPAFLRVP